MMGIFFTLIWMGAGLAQAETSQPPMVARTVNGAYVDLKDQLNWVIANPKLANQFPEFKKRVIKRCNTTEGRSDSYEKIISIKKKALDAAGWYEEWLDQGFKKVNEVGLEMMRGDFSHDPLVLLVVMEKEAEPKDDLALARHYAPLALMQSIASKDELSKLENLSKKSVSTAQKELIAAIPGQAFWLGGNWTRELYIKLKKIMPDVARTIKSECDGYLKDPSKDPIHVNLIGCKQGAGIWW